MRRPAFRLFVLLIAWCVGFQSTAAAMGMRCAHGKTAMSEMAASMQGGMHHVGMHHSGMQHAGMAPTMDLTHPASHMHHHLGACAKAPTDSKTGTSSVGCQCGCNCSTVGCMSSGPGIVSLNSGSFFQASPAAFLLQEEFSGLRAAHGLDLIRPPSKS